VKEARDRLVVALDVDDADRARVLVQSLRGRVGLFKVGLELFTLAGPELVRELTAAGEGVFLDLKLHDIPNTVRGAAAQAARLGARMITVHALGGAAMIAAAVEGARTGAGERGGTPPVVLAVTVLTSLDRGDLDSIGLHESPEEAVPRLAALAQAAGADGVVASPREVPVVRARCGQDLVVLTPGIRPAGESSHDQKRTLTPAEAVAAGADYIVVGRPITRAPDPAGRAAAIVASLDGRGPRA
jgi:orotidine-5'-phosphate decarboxylase